MSMAGKCHIKQSLYDPRSTAVCGATGDELVGQTVARNLVFHGSCVLSGRTADDLCGDCFDIVYHLLLEQEIAEG